MKVLRVSEERCTGCESCVLNCTFHHNDIFGLDLARVIVLRDEENANFRPQVCIQCDGRYCISACPQGALSINSITGAIQIDQARCTGCRLCERACPYGGIHFVKGETPPFICDLCGGDPECVKACQKPQAIVFVEAEEGQDEI